MEPAKIDWKNLEWVFIEDELYEHINAPKWFDFSAPQEDHRADDVAWFCRPGKVHFSCPSCLQSDSQITILKVGSSSSLTVQIAIIPPQLTVSSSQRPSLTRFLSFFFSLSVRSVNIVYPIEAIFHFPLPLYDASIIEGSDGDFCFMHFLPPRLVSQKHKVPHYGAKHFFFSEVIKAQNLDLFFKYCIKTF